MRSTAPRFVYITASIALILIALLAVLSFRSLRTLDEASEWVAHTERVRLQLERVLSDVKDIETGLRGYLLTNEDVFLDPYRAALPRVETDVQALRTLVRDNPKQAALAERFDEQTKAIVAGVNEALVRRKSGQESTFSTERGLGNKARMDGARDIAREMAGAETRLLQDRQAEAAQARVTAYVTAIGSGVLGAFLIAVLWRVSARDAARIRESAQWLGTTLTSIGDAVIATDEKGRVKFLNPVASELTGWPAAEAAGRPLDEVFHIISEADRSLSESPVTVVLREGRVVGLANHTLLIRRDGVETPIEDSGAPIIGTEGSIDGVVLVFKDASVQRAAQIALEASEARFRELADSAPVMIWTAGVSGGCTYMAKSWYAYTGLPEGAALGTGWLDPVHPEDRSVAPRRVGAARTSRAPFSLDYRLKTRTGAYRWVTNSAVPRFDDSGQFLGYIGCILDVHDRRRVEEQMNQSQKVDALGTLAGGIAHDFNNILGLLTGQLDVARIHAAQNKSVDDELDGMGRGIVRAANLVRQILTFARQQETTRSIVDVSDAVKDAVGMLRSTLPASVQLDFRASPNLPLVLADPMQIQQVITNLGINASQAMTRDGGRITVMMESVNVDAAFARVMPDLHERRHLKVTVEDTGSGMPRAVQERIFEPFFTTKAVGSGTGLGLSVVQGIVKNHDGAITVYSEPGRGTRFSIYLPAMTSAGQVEIVEPTVIEKGRGQHVLFIDDEATFGHLASMLFPELGYRVTTFTNPAHALKAFEADPQEFDAAITDLSMPGFSGLDVARALLEMRPNLPIALATGYIQQGDIDRAKEAGIREVVLKPIPASDLGILLQRLMG